MINQLWPNIKQIFSTDNNAANERQRTLAENFRDKLDKKGYRTRVFNPAGQDDIGGGCGQLFHTQKWMKEHAELTIHSIGHDKEKVHMPI